MVIELGQAPHLSSVQKLTAWAVINGRRLRAVKANWVFIVAAVGKLCFVENLMILSGEKR